MNRSISIVALACGVSASTVVAQQAVQWKVSEGGNGHWYAISTVEASWHDASSVAQRNGGQLASITSSGENSFLMVLASGLLNPGFGVWVGGYQLRSACEPACDWSWMSGEGWAYTNWAHGEPNNQGGNEDRVELMLSDGGRWNDNDSGPAPEGNARQWIFEWSTDCNNDGIVDYGQCRDGSLPDFNGNNVPDCCERGESCAAGSYPVQWRVEEGGNGHWYAFEQCTTGLSAEAVATAMRGHLVTIGDAAENAFALRVLQSSGSSFVMLGLVQSDGQPTTTSGWAWCTGEEVSFTNWTDFNGAYEFVAPDDRPCAGPTADEDNQCNQGIMYLDGRWDDIERGPSCAGFASSSIAIVEFDADCNSDGIVDYGQILQGQLADANANGVPDSCESPTCADADLYPNGAVNGADLGILLSEWGAVTPVTSSDFNRDGVVDGSDLGILLSFWGPCAP